MGRATIAGNLGKGRYLVNLDYGTDIIAQRVADLDALIAKTEADKTESESRLEQAEVVRQEAIDAVNQAIDAYKQAVEADPSNADQIQPLTDASTTLALANKGVVIAALELQQIEFSLTELQKSRAALLDTNAEEQKSVWCADYTEDASGDVSTCEVPGEPNKILVSPGGRMPTASDGVLVARGAMTPEQAYFNAAILPGWQKFKPTYRVGVISNINEAVDTCSVSLDNIPSSAQSLDVNAQTSLDGVPIQYMTCNAKAFKEGERVLVIFEGQQWANPKVIGFADGPKTCPFDVSYFAQAGLSLVATGGDASGNFVVFSVRKGESAGPVSVIQADPYFVFTKWSDDRVGATRTDGDVQEPFAVTAMSVQFPQSVTMTPNVIQIDGGGSANIGTQDTGDTFDNRSFNGLTELSGGTAVGWFYNSTDVFANFQIPFGFAGFSVAEQGALIFSSGGSVGEWTDPPGTSVFQGQALLISNGVVIFSKFAITRSWTADGYSYATGYQEIAKKTAAWEKIQFPQTISVVHTATGTQQAYDHSGFSDSGVEVFYSLRI